MITGMTPEQQGDLSRLRRIKEYMQRSLEIIGDPAALNTCVAGDVASMQDNLIRSYVALGNALSSYGDQSVVGHSDFSIPKQRAWRA